MPRASDGYVYLCCIPRPSSLVLLLTANPSTDLFFSLLNSSKNLPEPTRGRSESFEKLFGRLLVLAQTHFANTNAVCSTQSALKSCCMHVGAGSWSAQQNKSAESTKVLLCCAAGDVSRYHRSSWSACCTALCAAVEFHIWRTRQPELFETLLRFCFVCIARFCAVPRAEKWYWSW